MGLMTGKRGLILGLANEKSIAWGIARTLHAEGAEIGITYVGEAMKKRVEPLGAEIQAPIIMECDVSNPDSISKLIKQTKNLWDKIDFLVHAIGYSDKFELRGQYINTSRDNFLKTLDISAYSFTAILQAAKDILSQNSSCLTLTYYGAEKVMPNYNVMGVAKAALEASVRYLAEDLGSHGTRVNAISAGTIKTLAASGIGDFREIMKWNETTSPLRRTVSQDEVGKSALYLLSDLGSGVTGEILHVDAGFHAIGMKSLNSAD
ncbi:MAG: SDR family oxidoreductase [Planktomarina sp.]|nr:SDR family oxidoreductase [Planktomarina sp.]